MTRREQLLLNALGNPLDGYLEYMAHRNKPESASQAADKLPEIKELLVHQLQLVSKESENAHGDTLAHLTKSMACLLNALMS